MKPEVINNHITQWGEGPVWWNDHLYYVDIQGFELVRVHPETLDKKVWQLGQRVGFALPCENGNWVWGGDEGLFFLDLETGLSTFIADPEATLPDNRFNDAAISPDGRLFAGSIAMNKIKGNASLYRVDSDLSCRLVFPNVTNSNGLGWSADGKRCYYIDTPSYNIRRFDYDPSSGEISNEEIIFNTEAEIEGVPDGMCVDTDENLWIAFCHGGCVIKFTPSGEILERINFSTIETTSCCFGGPEHKDLYITTGTGPLTSEEPDAGKIFVIHNAGQGLPQVAFKQP